MNKFPKNIFVPPVPLLADEIGSCVYESRIHMSTILKAKKRDILGICFLETNVINTLKMQEAPKSSIYSSTSSAVGMCGRESP